MEKFSIKVLCFYFNENFFIDEKKNHQNEVNFFILKLKKKYIKKSVERVISLFSELFTSQKLFNELNIITNNFEFILITNLSN